MTTELLFLTLTALFAASLWIPYIVGVTRLESEPQEGFSRPRDLTTVPAWVHRSHRAHLNLLEQFLPFAALVVVAHMLEVHSVVTIWASVIFFVVRIIHAAGMISGIALSPLRSIIFNLGWLCTLAMGWQVLAA